MTQSRDMAKLVRSQVFDVELAGLPQHDFVGH